MTAHSALLQVPSEIRMMIYEHLLDTRGSSSIAIRNKPSPPANFRMSDEQRSNEQKRRRSSYHVLEKTLMRRSYETTYCLDGDAEMHPAILAVSKTIREEAAHHLYAKHSFNFGGDLEAVAPFLGDMTPSTRELVQDVTLYKNLIPANIDLDSYDWAAACRTLKTLPRLNRLTVVVGGGRPQRAWDGPRELGVSDLRLLYATKHDSLEWVRELAGVKALSAVEIVADIQHMPQPKTTPSLIFAAMSASIETSLVEFLRTDIGIPAVVGQQVTDPEDYRAGQGGCVAS